MAKDKTPEEQEELRQIQSLLKAIGDSARKAKEKALAKKAQEHAKIPSVPSIEGILKLLNIFASPEPSPESSTQAVVEEDIAPKRVVPPIAARSDEPIVTQPPYQPAPQPKNSLFDVILQSLIAPAALERHQSEPSIASPKSTIAPHHSPVPEAPKVAPFVDLPEALFGYAHNADSDQRPVPQPNASAALPAAPYVAPAPQAPKAAPRIELPEALLGKHEGTPLTRQEPETPASLPLPAAPYVNVPQQQAINRPLPSQKAPIAESSRPAFSVTPQSPSLPTFDISALTPQPHDLKLPEFSRPKGLDPIISTGPSLPPAPKGAPLDGATHQPSLSHPALKTPSLPKQRFFEAATRPDRIPSLSAPANPPVMVFKELLPVAPTSVAEPLSAPSPHIAQPARPSVQATPSASDAPSQAEHQHEPKFARATPHIVRSQTAAAAPVARPNYLPEHEGKPLQFSNRAPVPTLPGESSAPTPLANPQPNINTYLGIPNLMPSPNLELPGTPSDTLSCLDTTKIGNSSPIIKAEAKTEVVEPAKRKSATANPAANEMVISSALMNALTHGSYADFSLKDQRRLLQLIHNKKVIPKWVEYIVENDAEKPEFTNPLKADALINELAGKREMHPVRKVSTEHDGMDLVPQVRTKKRPEVLAAADGIVLFSGTFNGYGNSVILGHQDGSWTLYAHLSNSKQGRAMMPKMGTEVHQMQPIGIMGASGKYKNSSGQWVSAVTGPHLHVEYHTPQGERENLPISGAELREGAVIAAAKPAEKTIDVAQNNPKTISPAKFPVIHHDGEPSPAAYVPGAPARAQRTAYPPH